MSVHPAPSPIVGRAFTPRLVAEKPPAVRGVPRANPAMPNLIIADHGMRWPMGEVVAKSAFPNGFVGHLEMGKVVETDRPVTIQTALPPTPVPVEPEAAAIENKQLRLEISKLESQVATLTAQINDQMATIGRLEADLAAAEQMLVSASTNGAASAEIDTAAESPDGARSMGLLAKTNGLPVKASPWVSDSVDARPFEARV